MAAAACRLPGARLLRSVFVPPPLPHHLAPRSLLAGVDLRWTKILRSMRVLRVGLLSSELRSLHLSTRKGGALSAGANLRLFQLLNSVLILLFTTSSVIQIVERIPFDQALYMVGGCRGGGGGKGETAPGQCCGSDASLFLLLCRSSSSLPPPPTPRFPPTRRW